jgi:hypothetical protein
MSEVRLAWDANTDNPDGYKIYWGKVTNVYNAVGSPKDVGNVTAGGVDIDETATWFFALKAYNSGGESPFSAEISAAIALGCVVGRAN